MRPQAASWSTPPWSSWTSPGWSAGGVHRGGAGQTASWPASERPTAHRPRPAGGSTIPTWPGTLTRWPTCRCSSSSWSWPTSPRSRARSTSGARRPGPDKSLTAEGGGPRSGRIRPSSGGRRSTVPNSRLTSVAACGPSSCSPISRWLAVVKPGARTRFGDPEPIVAPVAAEPRRAAGRRGCSASASSSKPRRPQLDPDERTELLAGLGLGEGALPRVARAALPPLGAADLSYHRRHRRAGAWTFRAGARAPECAGVIHSDLQRGFIRARG